MARLKFAGRKKEIKKFEKFLHSEAQRVLLVIGKQGIGKTRLLEQLELECYGCRDLECLVYSYQIKGTDPPEQYLYQMMDEIWMKKNIFSRIIDKKGEIIKKSIWQISGIGKIFKNITESIFRDPMRPVADRFKIFLQEIVEGFKKKNQRFVLFIDPLDELTRVIHRDAWRAITQNLPYQVKLIIAQREKDVLADCIELTDDENVECWNLDYLSSKETKELVKSELAYTKPSQKFIDEFAERYKGYPLFIDGAMKLLRKRKDFTPEALKKLPAPGLTKLLYDKLGDDERNLVNHLSILEVPVDMAFLRNFTRIVEGKLDGLLRRYNVKDVIKEEENGKRTYQIYHQTFKDFVLHEMKQTETDIRDFHRKASKAFFEVMESHETNPDALKYSTAHLLWAGDKETYIIQVRKWLVSKFRYGMIPVVFRELKNCLKICEQLKLPPEYKAVFLGNMGLVHTHKGDLNKALTCQKKALMIDSKEKNAKGQAQDLNNIGLIYETMGDWNKAVASYERAFAIAKKVTYANGQAACLCNIGTIYRGKGNLSKSLSYFKKALRIYRKLGDADSHASNLIDIGSVYYAQGDLYRALSYYKKSLEIHKKQGNVGEQAASLGNIGLIHLSKGELTKALSYTKGSLKLNKKVGAMRRVASNLFNIGLVHFMKCNLNKALFYYVKSSEINRKIGAMDDLANNLTNIGLVYSVKGDLDRALSYYEKALEIHKKVGAVVGQASDLGNIGLIHFDKGDLEKALNYQKKALNISEKARNINGQASNLGNIALIYHVKGDIDKAISCYNRTAEIQQNIGNRGGLATVLGNIGLAYYVKGDVSTGLMYHKKALRINRKVGNRFGQASNFGSIGSAYLSKGTYDKALFYHKKALEINKKGGNTEGQSRALCDIGLVYHAKGDLDRSLSYHNQALNICQRAGMLRQIPNILFNIAFVYEDKKDLRNALIYFQESLSCYEKVGIGRGINYAKDAIERVRNRMDEKVRD